MQEVIDNGEREQRAIQTVENTTMARKNRTAILHTCATLHGGFSKIAKLTSNVA